MRDARATPWFTTKPSESELREKLIAVRRNELRLARALRAINSTWYPAVRQLYYGKGAR